MKQIIALGGGGFSDLPGGQADEPDNSLLDEYILQQSGKVKPKICFLPTAGGDPDDYIERFYRTYKRLNCTPSHLPLTKTKYSFEKLEEFILSQDIIFVGGGSTKYLIEIWKKLGMDGILKDAWKQGIILSGMSAGAMCWFKDGFTNPTGSIYRRLKCLGFLEGSFCPHFDKENQIRKIFRNLIKNKVISEGYGVEDGVALHFLDSELVYVVSSGKNAKAYYMKVEGLDVKMKIIKPVYLSIAIPATAGIRKM